MVFEPLVCAFYSKTQTNNIGAAQVVQFLTDLPGKHVAQTQSDPASVIFADQIKKVRNQTDNKTVTIAA